jgi:hypothetical protein
MIDFPKVFWDFQKWTFIFVHFLLSEKGFGAKNRIFTMLVGTFGSHKYVFLFRIHNNACMRLFSPIKLSYRI